LCISLSWFYGRPFRRTGRSFLRVAIAFAFGVAPAGGGVKMFIFGVAAGSVLLPNRNGTAATGCCTVFAVKLKLGAVAALKTNGPFAGAGMLFAISAFVFPPNW